MIRPTTLLRPERLGRTLGLDLWLASETFQHTGSFKFRAALEVARSVHQQLLITASSGNFGQALAAAAEVTGKRAIVVMPSTSARVKVEAVRSHGARVELIDTSQVTRAERVAQLVAQHPEAYRASAYDDPLVIRGNSSLGAELAGLEVEAFLCPVGGGGLISGLATGLRRGGNAAPIFGAEPWLANDAARSLRAGELLANDREPPTLADGARTLSLGAHNWPIVREHVQEIFEIEDSVLEQAVRLLFLQANLKVEPTGALAVAALLGHPERFRGQRVVCIVSGGNVDPEVYCKVLQG